MKVVKLEQMHHSPRLCRRGKEVKRSELARFASAVARSAWAQLFTHECHRESLTLADLHFTKHRVREKSQLKLSSPQKFNFIGKVLINFHLNKNITSSCGFGLGLLNIGRNSTKHIKHMIGFLGKGHRSFP